MTKTKQTLSKLDVISLVIGSVIGWGAFYLPGNKLLPEAGVVNTAIAFLIGVVLIYFIQMGYHVMVEHHHERGGEFSYVFAHLGRGHGFLVGWALTFCYLTLIPLNATAVVLVLKELFGELSFGYLYTIASYPVYVTDVLISTVVILAFYWINLQGIHLSMRLQKLLIISLVAIVAVSFVYMLFFGDRRQFVATYLEQSTIDGIAILKVLAIIPFLFVGFDIVPQVLTDLGFPHRFATRMTLLATIIGMLIYNMLNIITALAYTPNQASRLVWASGGAILEYAGWLGFSGLCLALFAAVVGGINGFLVGSSRVLASLATHKLLPAYFAQENHYGIPTNALRFVTMISVLMPFLGRSVILYIVDLSSLMAAVTYAYVCYVSSRLTEKRIMKSQSLLGMLLGIVFAILLVFPNSPSQLSPYSFGILGVWVGLGFLYFHFAKNKQNKKEFL
ncbi:APC family permease [Streptococcus plurextorum]|uniref:APC family permease n=1 Tax=Streptococcus plurextorum TaxID=456876 RepID=UPI00040E19BE|nr:APC family permease [Streptococcus plurextorum]